MRTLRHAAQSFGPFCLGLPIRGGALPTIRDLVAALRRREGVEAAIVLGRDGLVIESLTDPHFDAERVAAHVPSIIQCSDELGGAASRGTLQTAILEHERGLAVISCLSDEAVLLLLLQPSADVGQLLYELRRHRTNIAALV